VDLTVRVAGLPVPGETVVAIEMARYPGGKGANQAAAAARLGAQAVLVAALGSDAEGEFLVREAAAAGIDPSHLHRLSGVSSGRALITVDCAGENTIVVVPGANAALTAEHARESVRPCGPGDVVSSVLEIPLDTIGAALSEARERGALTLLNLSPMTAAARPLLAVADVLVLNGHEAQQLSGHRLVDERDWVHLAQHIESLGPRRAVVTLGAAGASVLQAGSGWQQVAAVQVAAVDTTGCGDAFTGALAANLAQGTGLLPAARLAVSYAALAATRPGAQSSYADRAEFEAWMRGLG